MQPRDYDECECGDYRHQHENGTGRCRLGTLCTPYLCQKFVLARLSERLAPAPTPDAGEQGAQPTTLSGKSAQEWHNHIDALFAIASPGEDIPWQALLAWTGTPTEEDFEWARKQLADIAASQAAVPESQDGFIAFDVAHEQLEEKVVFVSQLRAALAEIARLEDALAEARKASKAST